MALKSAKLAIVFLCVMSPVFAQTANDARMNQIQVIASHNSYKSAIDPALLESLRKQFGDRLNGLEYSHLPVQQQLDLGLRGLEIDVVYDPNGGLYAHPKGLELEKESQLPPGSAYDPQGLMAKPGFKVLHVPDIDFRANVYTFRQELAVLRAWSDAHPHHLPIPITMNAKDEGIHKPGYTQPLEFDKEAFDRWDAEIIEGMGRDKLILPDDIRGEYPTLEAAALAHAWPKLSNVRGKFFLVLDETGKKMETYIDGHPSLKGRVMFVNETEGHPEAAFRIVNEPEKDLAYIQYLVRAGYYVRTRADADTVEARKGTYNRWLAALESGAQVISTDYYVADRKLGTGYSVKLPGGQPGRWNILLLPQERPVPNVE